MMLTHRPFPSFLNLHHHFARKARFLSLVLLIFRPIIARLPTNFALLAHITLFDNPVSPHKIFYSEFFSKLLPLFLASGTMTCSRPVNYLGLILLALARLPGTQPFLKCLLNGIIAMYPFHIATDMEPQVDKRKFSSTTKEGRGQSRQIRSRDTGPKQATFIQVNQKTRGYLKPLQPFQ